MAGKFFTESEIDAILVSVEQELKKSTNLVKSVDANKNLSKAFGDQESEDQNQGDAPAFESAPESDAPAAPSSEAPAEDMPADAQAMPEAPEQAPEAPAEGQPEGEMPPEAPAEDQPSEQAPEGEESLEQEGEQGQDLSDDELHEIYSSMEPADLERHYMIIRGLLRDAYAKAEESESEEKEEESKECDEMEKCGELTQKSEKDLSKSESTKKIEDLEKSKAELEQSLESAIKAIEFLVKPERKAVTSDVEFVKKSEEIEQPMTKSEIHSRLAEVSRSAKLTKSDRDVINEYLLSGGREEGKEPVLEILRRK